MILPATGKNHFILLMDILGFSDICKYKDPETIYSVVNRLFQKGILWQGRDIGFKVLYFSDTIMFYQKGNLPICQAFNDLYVIASQIFTMLASESIPLRGAITYGEFVTRLDSSSTTDLFYGKALAEAADLEKKKKWLGIVISKQAIDVLDSDHQRILKSENVVAQSDAFYLLNPFIHIRSSIGCDLFELRDDYDYQEELKAIKFIKAQSENLKLEYEVLNKYTNTVLFIKRIFDKELHPQIWELIE